MAIITPADYNAYKGIEIEDDNALVQSMIDAAVLWLNREAHRTLVATADTARNYDAINDTWRRHLILDHVLAAAPTTVTIDGTPLAATEYTVEPRNEPPYDEIIIKRGSDFSWGDDNAAGDYEPEDAIEIVGKFGYYTTAPDNIKNMVLRLVDFVMTQKDAGAFETIAIPGAGALAIPDGFPVDVARQIVRYRRLV